MDGLITHIELGSKNGPATSQFFANLFGWLFTPMGSGSEGWFEAPTCKAGLHSGAASPNIMVFFAVHDIEKSVAAVQALGGEAGSISPDEPGFGRFCSCKDPEGVPFGLHQTSK
jgi:uncharacterized protein